MSHLHDQRTRLVVDKPEQGRMILAISWPPVLVMALSGLLFAAFVLRLSAECAAAQVQLPSFAPIVVVGIAFLVLATIVQLYGALRFSHRVAGPAYRLGKTLEQVRLGDAAARARLRDGDHLQELASEMNEFLAWVERRAESAPASAGEPPAPRRVERPAEVSASR